MQKNSIKILMKMRQIQFVLILQHLKFTNSQSLNKKVSNLNKQLIKEQNISKAPIFNKKYKLMSLLMRSRHSNLQGQNANENMNQTESLFLNQIQNQDSSIQKLNKPNKNQSQAQTKYVKDDLFLIKIKINGIQFCQDAEILKKSKNIQIDGQFSLKTQQINPFQINLKQYKEKYVRQKQKSAVQKMKLFNFLNLNNPLASFKNQSPAKRSIQSQKKISQQPIQRPAIFKKTKKSKTDKRNTLLPLQRSIPNNKIHQLETKDIGQNQIHQQRYHFIYKRKINSLRQNTQMSEQNNFISQMFNAQKQQRQKNERAKYQQEKQLYFNEIVKDNLGYIFAVTKDAFLQVQLDQKKKLLDKNKQFQLQHNFDLFKGRFPLKKFLQAPFILHKIEFKLNHKKMNSKYQIIHSKQTKKINSKLSLSMYCVPGDTHKWGRLTIKDILISNLNRSIINASRSYLKLRFQYPDLQNIKSLKSTIKQSSKFDLKAISVQLDQNPLWDQDFQIQINPKKNRINIKLIQTSQNKTSQIRVLGQLNIDLLRNGFLYEGIQMTKCIPFQNSIKQNVQKIGDFNIVFNFQINKKKYQNLNTLDDRGGNSFVDANIMIV